jgi:phosphoglycolate phosphatase
VAAIHLLFDLDGTLTDSLPGIHQCVNDALADLGRLPVSVDAIAARVGTPLRTIFKDLLAGDEKLSVDLDLVQAAVARYRAHYETTGLRLNRVYPGVPEALADFARDGHVLQVVTAKAEPAARLVLRHFGLIDRFLDVHGGPVAPGLGAGAGKAALVRAALDRAGAPADRAVMIGDRIDDILAARAHGIRVVVASWGYGTAAEFDGAAPDFRAASMAEVREWIDVNGGATSG